MPMCVGTGYQRALRTELARQLQQLNSVFESRLRHRSGAEVQVALVLEMTDREASCVITSPADVQDRLREHRPLRLFELSARLLRQHRPRLRRLRVHCR